MRLIYKLTNEGILPQVLCISIPESGYRKPLFLWQSMASGSSSNLPTQVRKQRLKVNFLRSNRLKVVILNSIRPQILPPPMAISDALPFLIAALANDSFPLAKNFISCREPDISNPTFIALHSTKLSALY